MTAAKLIREEIRNINFNDNVYPDPEAIRESLNESSEWNPPLLNVLMSSLVPTEIKRSSYHNV